MSPLRAHGTQAGARARKSTRQTEGNPLTERSAPHRMAEMLDVHSFSGCGRLCKQHRPRPAGRVQGGASSRTPTSCLPPPADCAPALASLAPRPRGLRAAPPRTPELRGRPAQPRPASCLCTHFFSGPSSTMSVHGAQDLPGGAAYRSRVRLSGGSECVARGTGTSQATTKCLCELFLRLRSTAGRDRA